MRLVFVCASVMGKIIIFIKNIYSYCRCSLNAPMKVNSPSAVLAEDPAVKPADPPNADPDVNPVVAKTVKEDLAVNPADLAVKPANKRV